jgi:hypothetical protein
MERKNIVITGKHNIDRLHQQPPAAATASDGSLINLDSNKNSVKLKRAPAFRTDIIAVPFAEQLPYLNQLYLAAAEHNEITLLMKKEFLKKLGGYKAQDLKHELVTATAELISYQALLEKLVIAKLQCAYCRQKMLILYVEVRDPIQWTLDRIDNNIGHSAENTVPACLKCNLKRRTISHDKYVLSKKIVHLKKMA